MKIRLLMILCLLPCCFACGPEYGTVYGTAYEFLVENKLNDKTVKIVPKSKTDFWISSSKYYVVTSGEKIIIGSKVVYDENKKAKDIYQPDDIKQEKTLSQRKFWDFSLGKVNNNGKYILIITENTLND